MIDLLLDGLHVEAVLAVSKDLTGSVLDAQDLLPNPVAQDAAQDATKWALLKPSPAWLFG